MFKIGEFSKFSRVSVKMLRHYDEIGLFKPAEVDPSTNYRYYSAGQLPRLHRILALRDLGFGLEQIGLMLDDDITTEQIRGMLKLRRLEIQQRLQQEEDKLASIEARLSQIDEEGQQPFFDVVLRSVMPSVVAAIRQPIGNQTPGVTELFEELESYVGRYKVRAPLPPLLLYHDLEYQEQEQDIEVAVPVKEPFPATNRVRHRELEGFESVACVIHTGSYRSLPSAYDSLLSWIEANHYQIAGPTREVFYRFGASLEGYELPGIYLAVDAAEFVTELQIPIEK